MGSVPLSRGISLIGTSSTSVKSQNSEEQRRTPQSSQTSLTEGSKEDRDDHLTRKLKIPLFDGEDVDSWVLRMDQYFEIATFTEEEKLRAVRMSFIGEALSWYRWERGRNQFQSWSQMKDRALEQFSTTQDITAGERLMPLQQESSVRDYIRDFKALEANAPEYTEATLELAFMHGLKPKIRAGVKILEPRTLEKMISIAKRVEDWETQGDSALVPISESKTPS